jgi:superfamily II DNA or RNA helicase
MKETKMLDLLCTVQPKSLRPYQVRAIQQIRSSLARGNRRVVCQGPTGFGKTLVAAKIIEGALAKGNRVIFTAPAILLIDQSIAAFEAEGIRDIGVMQANHPRTNHLAQVQVASVQTLARRRIPDAAVVIVDECHIRNRVIDRLMEERQDVVFIGLSATPWAVGMGLNWQDVVVPTSISDLIDHGYLSLFHAYAPHVPDLSGVRTQRGDFAEADLVQVMDGTAIVGGIVETWLERGENRPTLLFGVNRAHAKMLQEAFLRAGVAAGYCDAYTDIVERQRLEREFRAGEIRIACSVRTLTTGVDWPVSCIIDAAPTKSNILHVQKIGRGLRINPGTEDLLILDHAGNSLRLGLVTDIHQEGLLKAKPPSAQRSGQKEKLPRACSQCSVLFAGATCPSCGHQRKPVAGVDIIEADLVEVTRGGHQPSRANRQAFFSMALWLADQRDYKPGWAAHLFKKRFGAFPADLSDERLPADQAFLNYEKSRRIAWAKQKAAKGAKS